jgi:hypothetical protein
MFSSREALKNPPEIVSVGTPSIWARAICPHAPLAAAYERRASVCVTGGAAV